MQQGDFSAQSQGFAHIVRDEDGCFPYPVAQFQELILQFDASNGVQRAERLIEQQQLWLRCECPCHAHSLALAARKLAGYRSRNCPGSKPT